MMKPTQNPYSPSIPSIIVAGKSQACIKISSPISCNTDSVDCRIISMIPIVASDVPCLLLSISSLLSERCCRCLLLFARSIIITPVATIITPIHLDLATIRLRNTLAATTLSVNSNPDIIISATEASTYTSEAHRNVEFNRLNSAGIPGFIYHGILCTHNTRSLESLDKP